MADNNKVSDTEMENTRDRIMRVSAKLFCEKGYNKVSIREIAKACDINSAMIYYYFSSKKALLQSLYDYYIEKRTVACPNPYDLLKLAETAPAHEVFMQATFSYEDDVREMLDHILVAAAREIYDDPESEQFIRENVFDLKLVMKPLLMRLIELKKIKPFDVDSFLRFMSYYCFGAAFLNSSVFAQSPEDFTEGMSILFSAIPINVSKEL